MQSSPYNGLLGGGGGWAGFTTRGTFCKIQVYQRVGISQVEAYKRVCSSLPFSCLKVLLIEIFHTCTQYNKHYMKMTKTVSF